MKPAPDPRSIALADSLARKWDARTPSSVSIKDIRGAAYLGLMKASARHREDKGALQTYAYWRIQGEILDMLRKSQDGWSRHRDAPRFQYLDAEPMGSQFALRERLPDPRPNARQTASRKDVRRQLCRAKANLKPIRKHMVELYYYSGYKLQEIAALYEITPAAVSAQLKTAREEMRRRLNPELLNQENHENQTIAHPRRHRGPCRAHRPRRRQAHPQLERQRRQRDRLHRRAQDRAGRLVRHRPDPRRRRDLYRRRRRVRHPLHLPRQGLQLRRRIRIHQRGHRTSQKRHRHHPAARHRPARLPQRIHRQGVRRSPAQTIANTPPRL